MARSKRKWWEGGLKMGPPPPDPDATPTPDMLTALTVTAPDIDAMTLDSVRKALVASAKNMQAFTAAINEQRRKDQENAFKLANALAAVLGWRRVNDGEDPYWLHRTGYVELNSRADAPFPVSVEMVARVCRFLGISPDFKMQLTSKSFSMMLGNNPPWFLQFDLIHAPMEWHVTVDSPTLLKLVGGLISWCSADMIYCSKLGREPTWLIHPPIYLNTIFDSNTGYTPVGTAELCPCGSGQSLYDCTCVRLSQFQ